MSMKKSGRTKKKVWTDACPWTKVDGYKKKNVDEVTLSYVGKTMTQSRRTKYI